MQMRFERILILEFALHLIFLHHGGAGKTGRTLTAEEMKQVRERYPEAYSGKLEGDIVGTKVASRHGFGDISHLWPDATVPYFLDELLTNSEQNKIRRAMNFIEAYSCIRFIPKKKPPKEHLRIQNSQDGGCYSNVGVQAGTTDMNLGGANCFDHHVIEHELFHALGVYHEHNRYDRELYISVLYSNMKPENKGVFYKEVSPKVRIYGPYDYKSIMHYGNYVLSSNGDPTMLSRAPGARDMFLGNEREATAIDWQKLNKMYKCNQTAHI